MATLDSALAALRSAITTALAGANLQQRGKVFVGWPTATEWEEIASQDSGGALVSIYPLAGAKYDDPNPVNYQTLTAPVAGTTATLSAGNTVVTIGGAPKAGDTVHLFFTSAEGHASYLVNAGDSAAVIAAALAASINSSGVQGVTGSASGNQASISGAYFEKVNVGGAGSVSVEVARVKRQVQVTVWASSANDSTIPAGRAQALNDRQAIGETILTNVGTALSQWLTDASGDLVYCSQFGDRWSDEPSDSYTTFRWDLFYDIVYSLMQPIQIAQLEAVQNIVAQAVPATIYAG